MTLFLYNDKRLEPPHFCVASPAQANEQSASGAAALPVAKEAPQKHSRPHCVPKYWKLLGAVEQIEAHFALVMSSWPW